MGRKLCPKVILEGTRLTFKTEIAFALNEHPRMVGERKYRYHSPVISGEWCAFTNRPWGRGLINYELHEAGLAMETYRTWVRLFELQRYYSWIIDRFHISTRAYQIAHHGTDVDFNWLEERLLPLGFRIIFSTRNADSFAEAKRKRLEVSGNPSQYDDIGAFVREQELLEKLITETRLPVFRLDVSDNNVEAAADRVAEWMASTGGLFVPDEGPEHPLAAELAASPGGGMSDE